MNSPWNYVYGEWLAAEDDTYTISDIRRDLDTLLWTTSHGHRHTKQLRTRLKARLRRKYSTRRLA